MVVQRVDVRRVRRPFILANEFTAVGSNPVLSQLCRVYRHAVLLKDEAILQNRSAILNKFWQQGFNISLAFTLAVFGMKCNLPFPPKQTPANTMTCLVNFVLSAAADVHRLLCESWQWKLRTYAKINYIVRRRFHVNMGFSDDDRILAVTSNICFNITTGTCLI